ncbi:MAG: hypothetical protein U1F20_04605 [Lysobacterales bacterium]
MSARGATSSASASKVCSFWRQPPLPIQRWLSNCNRCRPAAMPKALFRQPIQAWLSSAPRGSTIAGRSVRPFAPLL